MKKGSGKGFFANTKWKEKLLCVGLTGTCLFYDDKVRVCGMGGPAWITHTSYI